MLVILLPVMEGRGRSVEQTEAHVIIFLGLWLRLLGSSSSGSGVTSRSSSASGRGGSGRDRAELLCSFLDQLLDVLTGELGNHLIDLLVVSIDTNRTEK